MGNIDNVLSITQLNSYIKLLIDKDAILSDICVRGEISNCKIHSSGHVYMSLKDDGSVIRAVMFRSQFSKVRFRLENGLKVIARGRVSVFERDGQYQLYVDSLTQEGTGNLYLQFEALKEKLKNAGLFEQSAKKKIPRMPETIGIVTSPTGAAIRDMINILKRRYPLCEIIIYPSLVQGENAAADLAKGIEYFNQKKEADVIIIGRGGGSIEDLWAFNDENLANVIYNSKIPVISAVGHETDFTICDFVADLRAPTPSAAAELCTPDIVDIYNYLLKAKTDMAGYMKKHMDYHKNHLDLLSKRGVFTNPQRMFYDKIMLIEHYRKRILSQSEINIKKKRELYVSLSSKLETLGPLSVLKRGYSIAMTSENRVISSVDSVFIGDNIDIILLNGKINTQVKNIQKD